MYMYTYIYKYIPYARPPTVAVRTAVYPCARRRSAARVTRGSSSPLPTMKISALLRGGPSTRPATRTLSGRARCVSVCLCTSRCVKYLYFY